MEVLDSKDWRSSSSMSNSSDLKIGACVKFCFTFFFTLRDLMKEEKGWSAPVHIRSSF